MTSKNQNQQASLKRRIRLFYKSLNQGLFADCHEMIDPRVRSKPSSVTLLQYKNSLCDFRKSVGQIEIVQIDLELHLNERSALYEDRDFAVGQTHWLDQDGESHLFMERWVREGRAWYTRSTGFLAPSPSQAAQPAIGVASGRK